MTLTTPVRLALLGVVGVLLVLALWAALDGPVVRDQDDDAVPGVQCASVLEGPDDEADDLAGGALTSLGGDPAGLGPDDLVHESASLGLGSTAEPGSDDERVLASVEDLADRCGRARDQQIVLAAVPALAAVLLASFVMSTGTRPRVAREPGYRYRPMSRPGAPEETPVDRDGGADQTGPTQD